MMMIAWAVALLILLAVNYRAARSWRPQLGRATLFATTLPAVALIGWYGARLAYAIVNSVEVNRRFREGDLTYFGADTAFIVSLGFGGLWILLALVGFNRGRHDRASTGQERPDLP